MTDALLTCLIEEHKTAAEFDSVLAEEQVALTSSSLMEVLPTIVERKSALASQLAELALERGRCLAAIGHANDRKGIEAAIRKDARLAPVWNELTRSATSARSCNLTNGMLLRTRLEYTRRAMMALREARGSGAAAAAVYGPDGRMPTDMR
jgi:flagella synthesis protein FlgN